MSVFTFFFFLIPAVSIKQIASPLKSKVSSIGSLVVPAIFETMLLSFPIKVFKRVDFPALGLPTIAILILFSFSIFSEFSFSKIKYLDRELKGAIEIYNAYKEEPVKVLEEREKYGQEELPPGAHKANKHYKPWLEKVEEKALNPQNSQNTPKVQASQNPQNPSKNQAQPASASLSASSSSSPSSSSPSSSSPSSSSASNDYLGIPYSEIIQKWWQMYNDAQEPMRSNRNTLTFELAVNLRHICGFDRNLLAQVIPCYDGFPEQEKMACINSALNEKITQMPKRLKDVLSAIRQEKLKLGAAKGGSSEGSDGDVWHASWEGEAAGRR